MTSRYADARLQIADYSTFLRKVRRDCPIWFVLYAELRGNHEQGAPGQLDAWLDKLFEHILVALPLAESAKIPSASVESVKTLRAECERLEHTVRAIEEQRRSIAREVDATRKLIETVSAPSFLIEKRILSLNAEDARASEQLARSSEALTTARLLLAAHEESLEATTIGESALRAFADVSAICEDFLTFLARESSTPEGQARAERAENSYRQRKEREERERARRLEVEARELARIDEINARNARRIAERRRQQMAIGLAAANQLDEAEASRAKTGTPPLAERAATRRPVSSSFREKSAEARAVSASQWVDEWERIQRKYRPWL